MLILFCTADRSDYGRDLANFLIHHLPEGSRSYGEDVPVQLPRLPELIAEERIKNGFSDRALVVIGHSLGGDAVYVTINTVPHLGTCSFMIICCRSQSRMCYQLSQAIFFCHLN